MPLDDDMEHIENCATKLCIENDIREHVEELTCTMFYRHKKSIGAKKNKGMASFLYNHHGPMVAAQSIVKLCTATYKVFLVALKLFTSFFTHGHQTKRTTKSGI